MKALRLALFASILLANVTFAKSFTCPKTAGAFPDENDCSGYWRCFNSVAMHMSCPKDTNFDPALGVCNNFPCNTKHFVTCKFTIGNTVKDVYFNDKHLSVSCDLEDWSEEKSFNF